MAGGRDGVESGRWTFPAARVAGATAFLLATAAGFGDTYAALPSAG